MANGDVHRPLQVGEIYGPQVQIEFGQMDVFNRRGETLQGGICPNGKRLAIDAQRVKLEMRDGIEKDKQIVRFDLIKT